MAFIRVGDTVINTDHIIAVELNRISIRGKCCVVITVAATESILCKTRKFWFNGEAAAQLREYFADPNNVTQLLPSSLRSQGQLRGIRQPIVTVTARSLVQPLDFDPEPETTNRDDESPELPKLIEDGWEDDEGLDPFIENVWDDEWSDPPDEPPPPTIRRRPWKPQPPDPLSTAASVESFNPPIP